MPSTKDFSFDDLGDVQVTLGHDEELLPEIRFHFDVEGIGNASIAIGFDADHEDTAVTMFDRLDKEAVQLAVEAGKEQINNFHSEVIRKPINKSDIG